MFSGWSVTQVWVDLALLVVRETTGVGGHPKSMVGAAAATHPLYSCFLHSVKDPFRSEIYPQQSHALQGC